VGNLHEQPDIEHERDVLGHQVNPITFVLEPRRLETTVAAGSRSRARPGQNRELLERIGCFQRELPSERFKLKKSLAASVTGATLIRVINSLHSLQPVWRLMRTRGGRLWKDRNGISITSS